MGDAVMPTQSKRRIITNRQLNFTLSPVDMHNHKEMPYSLSNYAIDGTWNQHQSIVLDIILDRIFKGIYRPYKNIPRSWRKKSVIDANSKFAGSLFNPVMLKYLSNRPIEAFSMNEGRDVVGTERELYDSMSDHEGKKGSFEEHLKAFMTNNDSFQAFKSKMDETISIFVADYPFSLSVLNLIKEYPILRQRPYKYKLQDYLQKIANTKFKMTYKVKCLVKAPEFNKKGKRVHPGKMVDAFYEMDDFQQIFSVKLKDDEFGVNFSSPLGKMVLHNTILLDTDWIADEVFELGKNAFFIYKRFILNRISGKNPSGEIELWFEDIKTFLDLKGKNINGPYSIIDRALKELREKELIKDFNWNNDYSKQRQYRVFFHPPSKASGDKRATKQKLLKV